MERYASMHRKTNETEVTLELCLDGGERAISTGVGFFDHMLSAFAVHGNFGLKVKTVGDWEVDCHHTIEDTGIVLGKAFAEALPTAATQKSPAPQQIPTTIVQKMYTVSRESLMAVRKRTMDKAPTMPRDRAMLFPMTIMTVVVMTARATRETLNLAL